MTAGKSTKSAAKGSKLAVKSSEAEKWKPRTDLRKERQRPAPKLLTMIGLSAASWLDSLALFKQDYLKEFREKNPKDKSSINVPWMEKLSGISESLRRVEIVEQFGQAPYEARALAASREYKRAVAKTASYRKKSIR